MNYLKSIFILLFMVAINHTHIKAQNLNTTTLVLDNYTIPMNNKGATIGHFVSSRNQPVIIKEDASGLFEISTNNVLKLKKTKQ